MNHKLSIIVLIATSLIGCTGVNPPKQPRGDKYDRAQIHVDSEELRKDTAVGTPTVTRDSNNFLHVSVPIRSDIDKSLHIDYWITWYDANGQMINKFTGITKTLQANTPDVIEATSTTPRAADFQLDLRYAH